MLTFFRYGLVWIHLRRNIHIYCPMLIVIIILLTILIPLD